MIGWCLGIPLVCYLYLYPCPCYPSRGEHVLCHRPLCIAFAPHGLPPLHAAVMSSVVLAGVPWVQATGLNVVVPVAAAVPTAMLSCVVSHPGVSG